MTPKKRILVVDDAGPMLVLCVNILQSLGYSVRAATSGDLALGLVRNDTFDLMLVDYRMPSMSGFDVFRQAHEIRPDMPVMLVTAYGTVDIIDDATELGFTSVLLKPFTRQQLREAVEKALTEKV